MLERFIKIRSSVSKALIDCCKGTDMDIFDLGRQEVAIILDIVAALGPIKVGAEKLGNRESTLLTSERIFSFILNELNQLDTHFSKKLKESFIRRISERRNEILTGLIEYLNSGKNYKKVTNDKYLPTLANKSVLISTAKQMLVRLFEEPVSSGIDEDKAVQEPDAPVSSSMTLAEKLDAVVKAAEEEKSKKVSNVSAKQHLKMELEIFEITNERTQNIPLLLDALKTIPPTSIESERAFSAAGLFIAKIRSRLSDRSIDHLCFLKSYYKNLK